MGTFSLPIRGVSVAIDAATRCFVVFDCNLLRETPQVLELIFRFAEDFTTVPRPRVPVHAAGCKRKKLVKIVNLRIWMTTACALGLLVGCSSSRLSDTPRTATEQLLVSSAIDKSLDQVDFGDLAGQAVYVDEKYLECVDKRYVVGSVRHRCFQSGARLVEKLEEADVVLELHCGAVGTDRSEGFLGIPGVSVPGPAPVQLPEVKLASQSSQFGIAKIGVIAYDPKTKMSLAPGGLARAKTGNRNWFLLGMGPLNSRQIRDELSNATQQLGVGAGNRIGLVQRDPNADEASPAESTALNESPADSPTIPLPPVEPADESEGPLMPNQYPASQYPRTGFDPIGPGSANPSR